ncbi:MAG TPA: transposase [Terriglobales bacterium]|nr:transposase [Terriglobales bacterium]
MPDNLKRYYGHGDFHFITFSCHRRLQLLGSARRRDLFLEKLEEVRSKYELVVIGYVVMPEHVHLLVSEPRVKDLSTAIKALKQSVSRLVWSSTRRSDERQVQPVPSRADPAKAKPRQFWQPRFYDFNVWTEKKRIEKLRYIHRNPVTRGLVEKPEDWRWSSYRFYILGEIGAVAINQTFLPDWSLSKVAD